MVLPVDCSWRGPLLPHWSNSVWAIHGGTCGSLGFLCRRFCCANHRCHTEYRTCVFLASGWFRYCRFDLAFLTWVTSLDTLLFHVFLISSSSPVILPIVPSSATAAASTSIPPSTASAAEFWAIVPSMSQLVTMVTA